MKQVAVLFKIALCFLCTTIQAQVLFSENFNSLAVGEVSADPTGVTPGKGGWYVTKSITPYTFPVEITPETGRGNVLVIGSNANNHNGNGAGLVQKNINTLWNTRTVGNNILKLEYEIYLTGSNQYAIGSSVGLGGNTNKTPTSLVANMDNHNSGSGGASAVKSFLWATYYDPASTPIVKQIFLGTNNTPEYDDFPYNTWLSVELFIEYKYEAGTVTGGDIYVYIPALNILKTVNFTHSETIDLLSIYGFGSGNLAVAVKYDNIKLTALNQMPDLKANVNDIISHKFNLYPNPATNIVHITNGENMLVQQIAVYDTAGKLITTENYNNKTEIQLNVENLASGTYMLHLQTNEGTAVKKLVKK